jgi:hypothetical protein
VSVCTLKYSAVNAVLYSKNKLVLNDIIIDSMTGTDYAVRSNDDSDTLIAARIKIKGCPNGFTMRGNFKISTVAIIGGGRGLNQVSNTNAAGSVLENGLFYKTTTYPIEQGSTFSLNTKNCIFDSCGAAFYAPGLIDSFSMSSRNEATYTNADIKAYFHYPSNPALDSFFMPKIGTIGDSGGVAAIYSATSLNGYTWDGGATGWPLGPYDNVAAGACSDTVTIFGSGLLFVDTIRFGNELTTNIFNASDDSLQCIPPPHSAGVVLVAVHNSAGTDTLLNGFEYNNLYGIAAAPLSGLDTAGGDTVRITTRSYGLTGATLLFDTAATTLTVVNDSSAYFITPAHVAGMVHGTLDSGGSVWDFDVRYGSASNRGRRSFGFIWGGFRF